MAERGDTSRRHRVFSGRLDDLGQKLQVRARRVPEVAADDDLVRILTKLTDAAERFDSIVGLQRKALEQYARPTGASNEDALYAWSERISLEAADMATCAREALEQLRRLGEPGRRV